MRAENFSELIYFIYGLSFFTMGIGAWLQGSHYQSVLPFVRSFRYLSAFGLIHGLVEWLMMILYMDMIPDHVRLLFWQTVTMLNALSFIFLWYFGIELYNSGQKSSKLPLKLPMIFTGIWMICSIGVLLFSGYAYPEVVKHESLFARYLIGFPASITASLALYITSGQYKFKRIKNLNVLMIVMSISFMFYAVFSGLIDLKLNLWPSTFLNRDAFYRWTGIPVEAIRTLLAVIITWMFIKIIPVFKYENDLKMSHYNEIKAISFERKRLSMGLHDTVLQDLFVTGLDIDELLDEHDLDPKVEATLIQARARLSESMTQIRRFITDITQNAHDFSDLMERINMVAKSLSEKFKTPIEIIDQIDNQTLGFISKESESHLFYMVQELIINALKHSQSPKITIIFSATLESMQMEVIDYGRGFDLYKTHEEGHIGLNAIFDRAKQSQSEFKIVSSKEGTHAIIKAPWKDGDLNER